MLKSVTPSVVYIVAKRQTPLERPSPKVRPMAGTRDDSESSAMGSGIVVDAMRGLIITDNHVIVGADEITVSFTDGRKVQAIRVGSDAGTDVAIIKVPAQGLRTLPLGDSDKLKIGDFVIAIGYPFDVGQTSTFGIVSGLRRSGLGIERYEDFIQTDAAINPGNSGGALVNIRGELIGVNTAIIGPTGSNAGIAFAIPINMVRAVMEQIVKYGDVRHGELGISMGDLSPKTRLELGLAPTQLGALVIEVNPNSAASRAGLTTGDVITAIDNASVNDSADFSDRLGLLRVGEIVELTVLRGRELLTIHAALEEARSAAKSMERKK